MANGAQVGRLAVAHGEDEGRADEDVDLAELDLLGLVEVPRRAKDDEQRVVVALELRSLVREDCVLDGERVELELRRQATRPRALRAVEADPRHAVGLSAQASYVSVNDSGDATRTPST